MFLNILQLILIVYITLFLPFAFSFPLSLACSLHLVLRDFPILPLSPSARRLPYPLSVLPLPFHCLIFCPPLGSPLPAHPSLSLSLPSLPISPLVHHYPLLPRCPSPIFTPSVRLLPSHLSRPPPASCHPPCPSPPSPPCTSLPPPCPLPPPRPSTPPLCPSPPPLFIHFFL